MVGRGWGPLCFLGQEGAGGGSQEPSWAQGDEGLQGQHCPAQAWAERGSAVGGGGSHCQQQAGVPLPFIYSCGSGEPGQISGGILSAQ